MKITLATLLIGIVVAAGFFLYTVTNSDTPVEDDSDILVANNEEVAYEEENDLPMTSEAVPETEEPQVIKGASAETYNKLQQLMETTPLANPQVQQRSLREFDIDGDGDLDVVGFMTLTFRHGSSDLLFSTWFNTPLGYEYFEDHYHDFRMRYKDTIPCSIVGMETWHVTLQCDEVTPGYLIELYYQEPSIGGYYRDFTAHAVTYTNSVGWERYDSAAAGVSFMTPPGMSITENSYELSDGILTIIAVKRDENVLFELHVQPHVVGDGGGVEDMSNSSVVIARLDGTYLKREVTPIEREDAPPHFEYEILEPLNTNNAGAYFASFSSWIIAGESLYRIRSLASLEEDIHTVDKIVASLSLKGANQAEAANIVEIPRTEVSFAELISFTAQAKLDEQVVTSSIRERKSDTLDIKVFDAYLVDSPFYSKYYLGLTLYPYGPVGSVNGIGGGGFDGTECYNYDKQSVPFVPAGEFQACQFGYGDAGISVHGYYLIDPDEEYVVEVVLNQSFGYDSLDFDLDDFIKSAKKLP